MRCPKCERVLQSSGELIGDEGETLPVYQCPECLSSWEVEGRLFEVALTFAVAEDGRVLDPESLQPLVFH